MANSEKISKEKVLSSFGWKMLERFCSQGLNLIVQILLARILMPTDFGSLAIMLAIINYASLFVQSGLATAIVQKKDLDDKDVNTLFTASIVIAAIMYIVLYFASPLIADSYSIPTLVLPLRVLSIVLFLNAINSVQTALLSRDMRFRQIFLRSVIAVPLAGTVGIVMALMGYGLWSLVVHTLLSIGLTVLVMYLASNYKLRFQFYWQRAKVLYSFSIKILMSSLVSGFSDTLRTLIIGKRFSTEDLAYYDKAYSYSSHFTQIISSSVSSVLLPTFSRSQDDRKRVVQMARRSVQITSFVVIPMLTLIMSISAPFVDLLLTEKWAPCIPFLIVFCMLRIPSCISVVDKQVYLALGNSKIGFYYEIGLLVVNVVMLLITVPIGVYAIALGYLTVEILGCFSLFCVSSRFYGYSLLMRIKDIVKPSINSLLVYYFLSLSFFSFNSDVLEIIVKLSVGFLLFILLSKIMKDSNLDYIYNIIHHKIQK